MKKELICVMLLDDNDNDNFFHEREIKKTNSETIVITKNSGMDALEYIKSNKENNNIHPDLIFLDINMPGMNGWEFLKKYSELDKKLQSNVIIVMLASSDNDADIARVNSWSFVSGYITKPLTKEIMEDIIKRCFK